MRKLSCASLTLVGAGENLRQLSAPPGVVFKSSAEQLQMRLGQQLLGLRKFTALRQNAGAAAGLDYGSCSTACHGSS